VTTLNLSGKPCLLYNTYRGKKMNQRENVLAAINHKRPERVPLALGATIVDGFTGKAKTAFERYLGLPETENIITSRMMGTVKTPDAILALYDMDFAGIMPGPPRENPVVELPDGCYIDEYGCTLQPTEYYFDIVKRPLEGSKTLQEIQNHKYMDPSLPGRMDGLKEQAKVIRESGKAVCIDLCVSGPFEQGLWMRGWEDFLCDLYTEPVKAEAILDKVCDIDIEMYSLILNEIGEYVDVVCQGDDLGMQDRPIISPEIYDKYIKKYHKRMYSFIHSHSNAKVFHHSCGSCYDLLPFMIEAGVDILNPVQTTAKNMQPEKLKAEFGKDLVFWGGLDVQKILPFASEKQIDDEVKRLVDVLGADGGYVFAPSHNIQPDVPMRNIAAMLDAIQKYR